MRHVLSLIFCASLCVGQILNIVAHQDDDILFLSPDLIHYIQAGYEVRTVFLTAGDSGFGESYWRGREDGSRTAYAVMSDSSNSWIEKDAGIPGHKVPLFRLKANLNISLVFLRLPDGNVPGQGFNTTGFESLQKLWEGNITSMRTVSGSGSYTKNELINTLVHLLDDFQPERVNTQDYVHQYGDGDHSDHHTTAYFVAEALKTYYNGGPALTGYMGYPVINATANVVGTDLLAKKFAYYAYGRSDQYVCDNDLACEGDALGAFYAQWLERQHTLDEAPIANAGQAQFAGLNAVVTLDGSASWDANDALIYEWMQIGGPPVDLTDSETSRPSFTTPAKPDTFVFELVVSNGQTSSPAAVTVTTLRYAENIAPKARVTASSSNATSGQTSDKAIDGSITGFPADYSHEWATEGGKAGSWLRLSWAAPQTISNIALYDRPNLDDHITGAIIELDDEEIELGELSNSGTVKVVDVGERTVHNVTVKITAVSLVT
ncbi:putative deacetylase LmbE-like domain-containing protein [Aspergillus unguis]